MPELWIAIAVFMSVACLLIMGIPAIRRWRLWRRRRALMRCFLHGVSERQLRVKYRRDKYVFGEGFTDAYQGTSGALPFRLEDRIEPWKDHRVSLGLFRGNDAQGEPIYERWHFAWNPATKADPIIHAYLAIRDAGRLGQRLSEAS